MQSGKILVAGATGRVGAAAVEHLLKEGFEVRALVRRPEKGKRLSTLGAELAVGDATDPGTLGRFVYSSVLMADHPLAQNVGAFREKARFEEKLLAVEDVSSTILRPAIFMETLDLMLRGSVAYIPGRQMKPVSWIAAGDIARAAVRAIQGDIVGRHEIAGPEIVGFDGAFHRLGKARGERIRTLHVPLSPMRAAGRFSPYVREMANMMAFFDAVGFATDPSDLSETFGVSALTIEEWAREER